MLLGYTLVLDSNFMFNTEFSAGEGFVDLNPKDDVRSPRSYSLISGSSTTSVKATDSEEEVNSYSLNVGFLTSSLSSPS